jgi:hypothetical protein
MSLTPEIFTVDVKETLNKSPRTSRRRIFRLTLPEKLEMHKHSVTFQASSYEKSARQSAHVDFISAF